MKRSLFYFSFTALLAAGVVSCKKDDTPTNPTTPTQTTPSPTTPTPANVSGALVSVQVKYAYSNPQIPIPVSLDFETAVAGFFTAPGATTYVDAGAVSVNTFALDKADNNAYTEIGIAGQTPSTLNFDNGSDWNVAGSGSVTGFTYSHGVAFPKWTGTLPTTVTKSSGLTVTIASNTTGADSVIVVLAAGSASLTKTVAGSAASCTFTAGELAALPNVTDNTGIIQVDPWRYNIVNKNGKDYAFIKEQANIGTININ